MEGSSVQRPTQLQAIPQITPDYTTNSYHIIDEPPERFTPRYSLAA